MPPITQVTIPGSNYQDGRAAQIDQITFHHIVGDAPAAISRFKGPGVQVSSTYVISSTGQIFQCVAEKNTPYTDANFSSNSRAITIEHAGGIEGVPYTDEMYAASAKLVAWIRSRYNITRFMRHRDVSSVPTACPGALDVERIIRSSSEEETMIDDSDIGILRIAHSEIGGWNFQETHAGKNDGIFLAAWKGKPVRDLIWAQWTAGGTFRSTRLKEMADYAGIVASNAELSKRPTQAQYDEIVAQAKANAANNGSYTATDRATATETNTLIKQIWGKITSVFK